MSASQPTMPALQSAVHRVATTSMKLLGRGCRETLEGVDDPTLEEVLIAMRAKAKEIMPKVLEEVQESPWLAGPLFDDAAMSVYQSGKAQLEAIMEGRS